MRGFVEPEFCGAGWPANLLCDGGWHEWEIADGTGGAHARILSGRLPADAGDGVKPPFRADIAGLRGLALCALVADATLMRSGSAGYAGLDVFMVICGYLTTAGIVAELRGGDFKWRDFYARRVRRLLPPLLALLWISLLAGWALLFADEFRQLGRQVAGGALFADNFFLRARGDCLDAPCAAMPLMNLWSLALLGQFYVAWPPLLVFAVRRGVALRTLITLLTPASLALFFITARFDAHSALLLPLHRAWEPLVGAAVAAFDSPAAGGRDGRARRAGLGFTLLGVGLPAAWSAPFGSLLPVIGTALLIHAGARTWFNRRLLSAAGLVWLGRHSYPLYLWYWPLLSFAALLANGPPAALARIGAIAVAALLAWATVRFLRQPANGSTRTGSTPLLLTCMALLAIAGTLTDHGLLPALVKNRGIDAMMAESDVWNYLEQREVSREIGPRIFELDGARNQVTLLMGDSHVAQYSPRLGHALTNAPARSNSAIFAVSGGCMPIPGVFEDNPAHRDCPRVRQAALELIARPEVKTVVIGAAWNTYFIQQTGPRATAEDYEYYYLRDGRRYYFRGGAGAQLAMDALERLLATLTASKTVFLLLDNPLGRRFDPHAFLIRDHLSRTLVPLDADAAARFPRAQRQLRERLLDLARRLHVRVLDPDAVICHSERCARLMSDGTPVYLDGGHLSAAWVLQQAGFMDQVLAPSTP